MIRSWLKKAMAVALSLGLMAGSFPIYPAAAAESTSLILNPGFEDTVSSDGTISGWTIEDGSGLIQVTNEDKNSGAQSLKMVDTGNTQSPCISSSSIAVKSGDKVSASIYAKTGKYDANDLTAVDWVAAVRFYDSNGNYLSGKDKSIVETGANGSWTQYNLDSYTVPDGASTAKIIIYSGGSTQLQGYFDDVAVSVTPAPVVQPTSLISNPGFEDAITSDGTVSGWEISHDYGGGTAEVTTENKYSGVQSLKIVDQGSGDQPFIMSSSVSVNSGDKISASVYAAVSANAGNSTYVDGVFGIRFFDSTGGMVTEKDAPDLTGNGGTWTQYSITDCTVPDGAASARVVFYGGGSAQMLAYFDDVAVSVTKSLIPSNYDAKTLVDYDCSSLQTLKDEGWMVGDPAAGAYVTDSTHSTGVPTGYTMKDVPSGNILYYMDKDAGTDYVDAFKLEDSKNMIENNPWQLELDMKFNDIMKVNTPDMMEAGFSAEVNTGVTTYRLNFGSDNKIRIENGWGTDYATWAEKDVDLHIGDGMFHKWNIECDGNGTVAILCDGTEVTRFDKVGIAEDSNWDKPGVQFINYNDGIVSNTNEIYFDNIKLTEYVNNPGTSVTVGNAINLGPMVMAGSALNLYSITAKNPVTNNDELYTVSNGSESESSKFYAIDPYTGAVLFQQEMPGTVHCYGIVQGSDKNIYVAGCDDGTLYRYTPGAGGQGKFECLGTNPSYSWIWDIAASNDGKIYGSTYDTANGNAGEIFEYDIATGKFTNLGPVKAGASYVRGLCVTDDYIYAGVGIPDALIRINRSNYADKTEITIPSYNGISGTGTDGRMCGDIWAYNGKLFVRDNAMKLFILDEQTGTLLNTISFVQAISSPSPYNSNIIYYEWKNSIGKFVLWQYDCSTNTTKEVDGDPYIAPTTSNTSNGLNWFTPTSGDKAGKSLLGITDDMGGYSVYDPTDNTSKFVRLDTEAQPVDIQSIEKGPDGKLYIGGYMHGASIYNTNTNTVENTTPIIDQPEGIGFLNGKAYFGTYGSAIIYSYDPTKAFDYIDNGTGNPSLAYDIGNDQDRPFVLTSGDNKLFVGTVPDYGKLGGALTIFDSAADKWTEYPNVVTDQSIVGLAYKDGMLYGGTSIYGGLGINPTQDEAKLFVWDVAKGQKVEEISLNIPGLGKPQLIGSLSFGPDGNLYGIADGAIFVMDPSTHEILRSRVLTNVDYTQSSTWRPYYIRWGNDGMLYTTIGRNIVAFNPQTLGYSYLATGVSLMTLGDDGNIYYASGSNLMELPVTSNSKVLSKVVISASESTLKKDHKCSINISAKMSDETDADISGASIEYCTSDPNVIIFKNGEIKGDNIGSAEIWAEVTLGGKTIKSNSITITVNKK